MAQTVKTVTDTLTLRDRLPQGSNVTVTYTLINPSRAVAQGSNVTATYVLANPSRAVSQGSNVTATYALAVTPATAVTADIWTTETNPSTPTWTTE